MYCVVFQTHTEQLTTVLINNVFISKRWEFHIIICVVGYFCGLFGIDVVTEDIHCPVAVGAEINLVACPHRENVLCIVVGDICKFLGVEVENPDVVSHSAMIVFPSAELTHHSVEGYFLSIGRIAYPAALAERQLLAKPALDISCK